MRQTIGTRIRQTREAYGMSQAELARRVGISATAMNQIESGKIGDPRVSRIVAIAQALHVSLDVLLDRRDTPWYPAILDGSVV